MSVVAVGRRATCYRSASVNVGDPSGKCQKSADSSESLFECTTVTTPPPHFHAEYGEHEITVDIDSGIVQGRFPRRALTAVLDWYNLHQDELARNWELIQGRQPLNPIEPLE